jgi:hypothetical protein
MTPGANEISENLWSPAKFGHTKLLELGRVQNFDAVKECYFDFYEIRRNLFANVHVRYELSAEFQKKYTILSVLESSSTSIIDKM